jgi:hypothetical protein
MTNSKPNRNVPTQPPRQKICEACGIQFPCFSSGGPCWCEDVKVGRETLAEVRSRYNDCLCPKCLAAAASAAKSSTIVS